MKEESTPTSADRKDGGGASSSTQKEDAEKDCSHMSPVVLKQHMAGTCLPCSEYQQGKCRRRENCPFCHHRDHQSSKNNGSAPGSSTTDGDGSPTTADSTKKKEVRQRKEQKDSGRAVEAERERWMLTVFRLRFQECPSRLPPLTERDGTYVWNEQSANRKLSRCLQCLSSRSRKHVFEARMSSGIFLVSIAVHVYVSFCLDAYTHG